MAIMSQPGKESFFQLFTCCMRRASCVLGTSSRTWVLAHNNLLRQKASTDIVNMPRNEVMTLPATGTEAWMASS